MQPSCKDILETRVFEPYLYNVIQKTDYKKAQDVVDSLELYGTMIIEVASVVRFGKYLRELSRNYATYTTRSTGNTVTVIRIK